jgi:hypothetical protein
VEIMSNHGMDLTIKNKKGVSITELAKKEFGADMSTNLEL